MLLPSEGGGRVECRERCVPKLDKVVGVEETGVDGRGTVAAETVGVAVIELVVGEEFDDVAMTRKVVRSKRMTSVALQAAASLSRCFVSTDAFGMRVCTICDQAYILFDVRRCISIL